MAIPYAAAGICRKYRPGRPPIRSNPPISALTHEKSRHPEGCRLPVVTQHRNLFHRFADHVARCPAQMEAQTDLEFMRRQVIDLDPRVDETGIVHPAGLSRA